MIWLKDSFSANSLVRKSVAPAICGEAENKINPSSPIAQKEKEKIQNFFYNIWEE